MTEAVSAMVDSTRSGRREAEKVKHEDILLQVLPVLNEAFTMKKVPELVIGGYMVSVVLGQKLALEEKVLDSLMEAVVGSWTDETITSGLICLSMLAQRKADVRLPKRVFKAVLRLDAPVRLLSDIAAECCTSRLLLGLVTGCVERLEKTTSHFDLLSAILQSKLLGEYDTSRAMAMVLRAISDAHASGTLSLDMQTRLADLVQQFNQSDYFRPIFQKMLAESNFDVAALEHHLQTVIEAPSETRAIEDVKMEDAEEKNEEQDVFSPALESLAKEDQHNSSFLVKLSVPLFDRLAQAFALAVGSRDRIESFANLRVLGKADATRKSPFLSFFVRVFSGHYPTGMRVAALEVILSILDSDTSAKLPDLQAFLPFLLIGLADSSNRIRRAAANILVRIGNFYKDIQKEGAQSSNLKAGEALYGGDKLLGGISWLSTRDVQKIIEHALLPEVEEYVLDLTHISKVLVRTLRGSSAPEGSGMTELKKSLRLSLFTFLCSHAVQIPLFAVKVGLLRLLNKVDKAGGTTRTNELKPLLAEWRKMNGSEVQGICDKEHLHAPDIEQQIVEVVTPKDKEAITILLSNVSPGSESLRPSFIDAIFGRLKDVWSKIPEDRQYLASDKLFDISLGLSDDDLPLVDGCKDVLRSVELNGSILLHFLRKIPTSLTDVDTPAPKRRRVSQNNLVAVVIKDDTELTRVMEKMTFVLELVDSSTPEAHPELADGLFQTLAALHRFKSQIHSGMSYLFSLALGSLLAIVNKSKV